MCHRIHTFSPVNMFKLLVVLGLLAVVMAQGPPEMPKPPGQVVSRMLREAQSMPGNPMPNMGQNMGPGNFADNIPAAVDPREWVKTGQEVAEKVIGQFTPGRRRRNV